MKSWKGVPVQPQEPSLLVEEEVEVVRLQKQKLPSHSMTSSIAEKKLLAGEQVFVQRTWRSRAVVAGRA